jgi:hypothetical protein
METKFKLSMRWYQLNKNIVEIEFQAYTPYLEFQQEIRYLYTTTDNIKINPCLNTTNMVVNQENTHPLRVCHHPRCPSLLQIRLYLKKQGIGYWVLNPKESTILNKSQARIAWDTLTTYEFVPASMLHTLKLGWWTTIKIKYRLWLKSERN